MFDVHEMWIRRNMEFSQIDLIKEFLEDNNFHQTKYLWLLCTCYLWYQAPNDAFNEQNVNSPVPSIIRLMAAFIKSTVKAFPDVISMNQKMNTQIGKMTYLVTYLVTRLYFYFILFFLEWWRLLFQFKIMRSL